MRYRPDIDGLRAVAVVLVIAYHAAIPGFSGGYVGVDVFFAVSGFLITGLLVAEIEERGGVAVLAFWARRVRRLIPLAAVVLVTTVALGAALSPPLARPTLVADARSALLYVSNWRFADRAVAYSDASVTDSLVLHYWSLSIEEQFYVLWPLLISGALLLRRGRGSCRRVLAMVAASVVCASLAWSSAASTAAGTSYFSTAARLWEIALGALVAVAARPMANNRMGLRGVVAGAGLLMALAGAVVYGAATPYPGWRAALPVVGTLLVIAAGPGSVVNGLLAREPLVWLGKRSYALYLWHWPLLGLVPLAADRWGLEASHPVAVAVALVAAVALAAASRALVEEPIRHARRLVASPRLSLGVGAGAMVVAALALVGVSRLPAGDTPLDLAAPGPDPTAIEPPDPGSSPGRVLVTPPPPRPVSPADARLPTVTCWSDQIDELVPDPASCRLGGTDRPDASGPRIVLIGDSHARMWAPALELIADQTNVDAYAWTKNSCFVQDAVTYLRRTGERYLSCETWRPILFSRLAAMSADSPIDLIVIGRKGRQNDLGYGSGRHVGSDPEAIKAVWRRGVRATIDALRPTGARIVFLGDVPRPGFSIPECLSAHPGDVEACAFAVGPAMGDELLSEVEREAADGVTVFWADTASLACPTDPCAPVTPDGVIRYADSHHLAEQYSVQLAPELLHLLEATGALDDLAPARPVASAAPPGDPRGQTAQGAGRPPPR
ncbi:MAG: acyltransferase [Actinomyces sp.]|nr:MAG: acyltransferase [Actinomyces sp.]